MKTAGQSSIKTLPESTLGEWMKIKVESGDYRAVDFLSIILSASY